MKKKIAVLLLIVVSFIGICLGVFIKSNSKDNVPLNVEKQEDYVLKYEVWNSQEQYIFVLTEENNILAQYKNADGDFEELLVKSDAIMIDLMKPYIDEVLIKNETEIEGYVNFTDFWYVKLCYADKEIWYDYGASECTATNVLLEQL